MPSHLTILRAIAALCDQRDPFLPVDPDLRAEAGMDGHYARLLQAARLLDQSADTAPPRGRPLDTVNRDSW